MSRISVQTSSLRRALQLVWQSAPGWSTAAAAMVVVQGFLPLVPLYLTKLIVDTAAAAHGTKGIAGGALGGAVGHKLLVIVGLLALVSWLSSLLDTVSTMISTEQSLSVSDRMHAIIHAKAIEADLQYFESADYFNNLHIVLQEAPYRPPRVVSGLFGILQSSIMFLSLMALLATLHPLMVPVLIIALLPGLWARIITSRENHALGRRLAQPEREANYFGHLLTMPTSAKEARLFDLGEFLIGSYHKLRTLIRRERFSAAKRRLVRDTMAQTAGVLAIAGLSFYLVNQLVAGAITLGALVMYFQALQRAQGALAGVLGGVAGLHESSLFMQQIDDFLNLEPKVASPPTPRALPASPEQGIVLENVTYRYEGSDRAVVRDVSLQVKPGEVIALVGENGSGKTTLVKLLCRLYDPTEGRITYGGIDVRDLALEQWRGQLSVVFQDYFHYHMSARENIWIGDVRLPLKSEKIVAAGQASGAGPFLEALPEGYDTHLGRWLREGSELSIGQWQKVALARAFVREAPIVILDEPTSALDPEAEYEVFEKFGELMVGRTAILISHRLSTVRMADRIYVMQDGSIVECGSHDELMSNGSTYARLYGIQSQAYL